MGGAKGTLQLTRKGRGAVAIIKLCESIKEGQAKQMQTTYTLEANGIARCHGCGYRNPTLTPDCGKCGAYFIGPSLVSIRIGKTETRAVGPEEVEQT